MRLSDLNQWGNSRSNVSGGNPGSLPGFAKTAVQTRNRGMIIFTLGIFWVAVFSTVAVVALRDGKTEQAMKPKSMVITKEAAPEMVEVLVPSKDIDQDKQLEPGMFIKVWRPKIGLPSNTIRSYDELRGTYARSFIPAHQPLIRDILTKEQPINPVIGSIPEGFRAVTINIDATRGVEGWARAGAIVDVHWLTDVRGKKSARLLVPNAKVLSAERQVDPHAEPGAPVPTTVTLLTGEREAQKISLAQSAGMLVLHLRGANDPKESSAGGTLTVDDLLGNVDTALEGGVEGIVKIKDKNGRTEEFAVMNGRIMRKK